MFLAEAAPVVEGPLWAQIVYAVVTALIAAFVIPYLRRKSAESAAALATIQLAGANHEANAAATLTEEVKLFLLERAANIAEKQLPRIAADVLSGGLSSKDDVKARLRALGLALKTDAIAFFREKRGLDLIAFMGDQQLDRLIEYVANKVSPFPGKESAVEFLKKDVSNWLIDRGVAVVRQRYLRDEQAPESATVPEAQPFPDPDPATADPD